MSGDSGDGRIAVYGATGYTGKLVAAELARASADLVLAGRDAEKLAAVAEHTGGSAAVETVALDDADGLRRLLEPCSAVIACAGPFALHGEPVLAAAVDTGTHYLDTTGEQSYMRKVFDVYGPRAEASGAALITAMGFDYVPGDMIASLTADGMGQLEEIVMAYAVSGFGMSRGTAHSGLGMVAGGDVEWRAGAYVDGETTVGRGTFRFDEPIGEQRMVRYPGGEQITVPRHVPTRSVRMMLTASTAMGTPRLAGAATTVMPMVQRAMRTPLRSAVDRIINRLPEGPKPESREAARFEIVCEARSASARRRGVVRGRDVYGMTARSIVNGALLCAAPGFEGSGALAPSQAFDPESFLAGLADFEIAYELEPLPAAVA